tara:strand:+ start:489 stop:743 length:255 start_codon:yes stop_codon:yes gene_type:complete
MTISEVDVDRIIRGPHDLEEQIDKLKKQVVFLQGKCRKAGEAILDLEVMRTDFKKEIDRLSEENDNLKVLLKAKKESDENRQPQ